MKMLARLRYLLLEGFQVLSVAGFDQADKTTGENAAITYVLPRRKGPRQLRTENFTVEEEEAMACAQVFLKSLKR